MEVGDKIVCIENVDNSNITVGNIYTITEIWAHNLIKIIDDDGNPCMLY